MSDLEKKEINIYEEEEESKFDSSDYDLFLKNVEEDSDEVNKINYEEISERTDKYNDSLLKEDKTEKVERQNKKHQKNKKKYNKNSDINTNNPDITTEVNATNPEFIKKIEISTQEDKIDTNKIHIQSNNNQENVKVLDNIDRRSSLGGNASELIKNNDKIVNNSDVYIKKNMDNRKLEESSSNINFGEIDYLLFGKSKAEKNTTSNYILCFKEFFSGVYDLIEVSARFVFVSMFFSFGLLFIILKLFVSKRLKSKNIINKLLFHPLGIYLKPLFDGRSVPFIMFNMSIIYLLNVESLSYSNNVMYSYVIIISFFMWPLYRAVRSAITKNKLNSKFNINGLPYHYKLKKDSSSKDDSLNWAYKNKSWTDTGHLDTKQIRKLDKDFEVITAECFWRFGYSVIHNGRSGDGGKDVIVKDENTGRTIIISCKRFSSIVPPNYVRELYGIVESERKLNEKTFGVLVTTVGYSKGSLEYAKSHGLILLTLDQLIEVLNS